MKTLSEINFGRRMAHAKPLRQVNIRVHRIDRGVWEVQVHGPSDLARIPSTLHLPSFDTRWQARDIAEHLAVLYRACDKTEVALDLSGKH